MKRTIRFASITGFATTMILVTAGAAAAMTANPALVDFGSVPVNTTATRDVAITVDAGYRFAGFGHVDPGFGYSDGTCRAFAGPGTCTVKLTFRPTTVGPIITTFHLTQAATSGTAQQSITIGAWGQGVSRFAANPASLDFGSVPLNTTATRDVAITVDAGYWFAGFGHVDPGFGYSMGTCSAFVGPGTCTVTLNFRPTTVGVTGGTYYISQAPTSGTGTRTLTIGASGQGVSRFAANPASLDFGSVPLNTPTAKWVTIRVDSGYRFGTVTEHPWTGFDVDWNSCSSFVGPGTCSIKVTYGAPVLGWASDTILVTERSTTATEEKTLTLGVRGQGVSRFAASPPTLDFGSVPLNTPATRTTTVTIDAGYRFGGATVLQGRGFGINSIACTTTVPVTCTLTVRYQPPALGWVNESVVVKERSTTSTDEKTLWVTLRGQGVSRFAANPASLDFGSVPLNTPKTMTTTVTIDAGYRFGGATVLPGRGFSINSIACTSTVPVTCTLTVRYQPPVVGYASDSIVVKERSTTSTDEKSLSVGVRGLGVSRFSANPASVDFGSVPLNTPTTKLVTMRVDAGYKIRDVSFASDRGFDASLGGCATFVGPGTCGIQLTYRAPALGGAFNTFTIAEQATTGTDVKTVAVQAKGQGVSVFGARPTILDLGSVPLNTSTFGDVTLTIDAGYRFNNVTYRTDAGFSVGAGTCASFAGPGTCTLRVAYSSPIVASSSQPLTISEISAATGGTRTIVVQALGKGVSTLAASPAGVDFGNVALNTTATRTVTLTIDKGYRFSVGSVGARPGFAVDWGTCQPGGVAFTGPGTCTIRLSYTAPAVGSVINGLSVGETSPLTGAVLRLAIVETAKGVSAYRVSPASVEFGAVPLNTTATRTVEVTVDAGHRFSVGAVGATAGFGVDWATCGGAGAPFTGPGTCTFKVHYTAKYLGLANNAISIGQTSIATGTTTRVTIPESATGVENVPPTTMASATFGKSQYTFGSWASSDVIVKLSATDEAGGSGVARTEYSLDGGATWTRYALTFAVAREGQTVLRFRSIDNAGNVEPTRSATIKIDKTAPTGSLSINGGAAATDSPAVTLTIAAADGSGSGVARMRLADTSAGLAAASWENVVASRPYTLPAGTGTKTVFVQYMDGAGNVCQPVSDMITLAAATQ